MGFGTTRYIRRDDITPAETSDSIATTISDYDLVLGGIQWSHVSAVCGCDEGVPADTRGYMNSACLEAFRHALALHNQRRAALDRMLAKASRPRR